MPKEVEMCEEGKALVKQETRVEVTAPSNLPGGFEFSVGANGANYKVRVVGRLLSLLLMRKDPTTHFLFHSLFFVFFCSLMKESRRGRSFLQRLSRWTMKTTTMRSHEVVGAMVCLIASMTVDHA